MVFWDIMSCSFEKKKTFMWHLLPAFQGQSASQAGNKQAAESTQSKLDSCLASSLNMKVICSSETLGFFLTTWH
jgi:hypothetical protein